MKAEEGKEEPKTAEPPHPRPIFRITNEERPADAKTDGRTVSRESKWTRDEHRTFVEGITR
ncbi:MAG: hypothetical protein P4M11_13950 [Candidatus Pacebacteria bacterium]|nr:hypothetical protein [Candidatus Paceibacterota bacterium]